MVFRLIGPEPAALSIGQRWVSFGSVARSRVAFEGLNGTVTTSFGHTIDFSDLR